MRFNNLLKAVLLYFSIIIPCIWCFISGLYVLYILTPLNFITGFMIAILLVYYIILLFKYKK